MHYEGTFTLRNGDETVPALIRIYTDSSEDAVPLVLAADPVTITWDEAGITDVVHRAQAEVRLIATDDGMYRDIMQSTEVVRMSIHVRMNGVMSLWWTGTYASSTCVEPFSNEKNYEISLTFSDFNSLEEKAYDGSLDTSSGVVEVEALICLIAYELGYARLASSTFIHTMPQATIGDSSFMELTIRDAVFRDTDGEPRMLLDILTDTLDAVNVHIVQYCGRIHLFCPDWFLMKESGEAVSGTLMAAGTDAELETCESYRRIELSYVRDDGDLKSYEPDMDEFTYTGIYADISDEHDGTDILAVSGKTMEGKNARLAMEGGDSNASMVLVLADNLNLLWTGGSPNLPQSVDDIEFTLPEMTFCVTKDQIPLPLNNARRITVELSMFLIMRQPGDDYGLQQARFPASVRFVESGGHVSYLKENTSIFSPSRYSWGDEESQVSLFLNLDSPNKAKKGTYTFHIYIPDPGAIGKIYMSCDLTGLIIWCSNGKTPLQPRLLAVGIVSMTSSTQGYFDTSILSEMDKIKEDIADTHDAVYQHEYAMGTPKIMTVNTISNISGYGDAGNTLLRRCADFFKRNMARQEGKPPRRTVHGTYMYDHLSGLPLFIPSASLPLATIAGVSRCLFVKSEVWHLRNGQCDLVIEESDASEYAPYPGSKYVFPSPCRLVFPAEGGTQYFSIISSGTQWNITQGDIYFLNPLSGSDKETSVLIKVDENLELKPRTRDIHINTSYGDNPGGMDTIEVVQAAGEPWLLLSAEVGIIQWGQQPPQIGISTNMDEVSAFSPSEYVSGVNIERGVILNISLKNTPGGRNSPAYGAVVDVTGKAEGFPDIVRRYSMVLMPPGFFLDTPVMSVNIPPEGGRYSSYYVEFRSNGNRLKINAAGTMAQAVSFWLYRRVNEEGSYQTMRELPFGTTDVLLGDDPGADEMQYYRIMPFNDYPSNTSGTISAAAFIVTASAPDKEDKKVTLVISQNSQ